jgi:glucokinase
MNTLAIDIGGTKFQLAAFAGELMVDRLQLPTDRDGGCQWMVQRITSIAREWHSKYNFGRCGIGFGGPVNFGVQRISQSTHVGGWTDFELPAHIRNETGIRAIMDNDANVGALGEAEYGAGRGCDPLFYMTLSTGIGGGIVIGGKIHHGPDSFAGEIGHINIRPDGPECLCGSNGCLERMCCGLWLERDYGRSPKELLQDPAFVERYVVDLARGLKACIMLLNVARIVIGGGIPKAGDALFQPLRAELARQITPWCRARVDVVPAGLGDDSVLWGALALAKQI